MGFTSFPEQSGDVSDSSNQGDLLPRELLFARQSFLEEQYFFRDNFCERWALHLSLNNRAMYQIHQIRVIFYRENYFLPVSRFWKNNIFSAIIFVNDGLYIFP